MDNDLQKQRRVALVTGASAGIGAAVAAQLVEAGMDVAVLARRSDLLEQLIARWPDGRGLAVVGDVTDPADLERAVDKVRSWRGGVDVLVQSAGGSRPTTLAAPDTLWLEAMDLNFHALRRLAHLLIPGMVERGWGRIVSITGTNEPIEMPVVGSPDLSPLNAAFPAKAATHAWSKGLSRLVARFGVTVNCVGPGRVHSEQVDERIYPGSEQRDAFAQEHIPAGRFGTPDECAAVVTFLASDAATYVTGEVIAVDGGMRRFAF